MKHGLYSKKVWKLRGPWSGDPEFKKLYKEIREEFEPDGQAIREEVRELAVLYYQRRCIHRRWQEDILSSPVAQDLAKGGERSWEEFRDQLMKSSKEGFEAGMLNQLSRSMSEQLLDATKKMIRMGDVEGVAELRGSIEALRTALVE